jgi:hypothetical protein
LRQLLEDEAIDGQLNLRKARKSRNERAMGYWLAYVESRERFLVIVSEMHEERR